MTETCGVERKRNKTLPSPYRGIKRGMERRSLYTRRWRGASSTGAETSVRRQERRLGVRFYQMRLNRQRQALQCKASLYYTQGLDS